MLKNQRFGVEIELTGITRRNAAKVVADYFGTAAPSNPRHSYNTYPVNDNNGRTWKIMRDSSISSPMGDDYRVELVTPILQYGDISDLQEILRNLRKAGAKANPSCGIHIHIDGTGHTALSLKNIVNFMCARQDLIYDALNVYSHRNHYCKKMCPQLLQKIKRTSSLDLTSFEQAWYSPANNNYNGRVDHTDHYNSTRYQCLNLHSFFYRGTIEFRCFNSTTHAGELKAYIQFCLAVSAWALQSKERITFKGIGNYTPAQKVTIMNGVLTNRLGLVGKEFKTARYHLTKHLQAAAATVAA